MILHEIPPDASIVYFRCYLDNDDMPCVVEMQNFDERDYRSDRFLTPDRYTEEPEAIEALIPFRTQNKRIIERDWSTQITGHQFARILLSLPDEMVVLDGEGIDHKLAQISRAKDDSSVRIVLELKFNNHRSDDAG